MAQMSLHQRVRVLPPVTCASGWCESQRLAIDDPAGSRAFVPPLNTGWRDVCVCTTGEQGRKCSMKMLRTGVSGLVAILVASTAWATLTKEEAKRLNEATAVLSELRGVPDNGIPDRIWEKARCVVVIPSVKKAAFIIGGEFGEGVMSCRQANRWGAPVFM